FQAVVQRRGLLAQAVMRSRLRHVEAGVMLEGLERHVLFIAHATGLPTDDPINRKHAAMTHVVFGGQQPVLVLLAVQAYGRGIVRKQVDHRRAVQAHVIQGRANVLGAGLVNIETQLKAASLFELLFRQAGYSVETEQVDEQELLGKGEVFLQVTVAAKSIEWVGDQRLVLCEADWLHLIGLQYNAGDRLTEGVLQRLAGIIQQNEFKAAQITQQGQIEHLADIGFAGEVKTQARESNFTQVAVGAHGQ